jgi:hypothetical protein
MIKSAKAKNDLPPEFPTDGADPLRMKRVVGLAAVGTEVGVSLVQSLARS